MRKYLCICIILIGLTSCSAKPPSEKDVALKDGTVNIEEVGREDKEMVEREDKEMVEREEMVGIGDSVGSENMPKEPPLETR